MAFLHWIEFPYSFTQRCYLGWDLSSVIHLILHRSYFKACDWTISASYKYWHFYAILSASQKYRFFFHHHHILTMSRTKICVIKHFPGISFLKHNPASVVFFLSSYTSIPFAVVNLSHLKTLASSFRISAAICSWTIPQAEVQKELSMFWEE